MGTSNRPGACGEKRQCLTTPGASTRPSTSHALASTERSSSNGNPPGLVLDPDLDLGEDCDSVWDLIRSGPLEEELAPDVEVGEADWLEQHQALIGLISEEDYPNRCEAVLR